MSKCESCGGCSGSKPTPSSDTVISAPSGVFLVISVTVPPSSLRPTPHFTAFSTSG